MESSGHARWVEGLLRQFQFRLWIGDAAEILTKRVRKQRLIARTRSCCGDWFSKIRFRGSG